MRLFPLRSSGREPRGPYRESSWNVSLAWRILLLVFGVGMLTTLGVAPARSEVPAGSGPQQPSASGILAKDCPWDLVSAYGGVLERLAAGERQEAVVELSRLYVACFTASELAAAVGRWGVELSVRGEKNALLPVLYLHLDVSRYLADRDKKALAERSFGHFERLLKRYRVGADEESREARAMALALGGWQLRDRRQLRSARELFRQAVELSPHRPGLWHLLGTLDEKLGDYAAAARSFSRLLEVAPDDAIGRLRLALLEARRGKRRVAREHLHRLVEGPGPPWVSILAIQELGRLEVEAGDGERGVQILRRGRERFPEDQGLLIASSHLGGDWREVSRRPVQALSSSRIAEGPVPGASPRGLYNEWPREEVVLLAAEMEQNRAESLLQLRRSLKTLELSRK